MALRVRDALSGIDSAPRCPHDLWSAAMAALKSRNRSLDAQNVDRLFGRDNRQVFRWQNSQIIRSCMALGHLVNACPYTTIVCSRAICRAM